MNSLDEFSNRFELTEVRMNEMQLKTGQLRLSGLRNRKKKMHKNEQSV